MAVLSELFFSRKNNVNFRNRDYPGFLNNLRHSEHRHYMHVYLYFQCFFFAAESSSSPVENQTTPVGNSKILRLFGVNLECQPEDESVPSMQPDHDHNNASSTYQHYYHHQHDYSSSVPHDYMVHY